MRFTFILTLIIASALQTSSSALSGAKDFNKVTDGIKATNDIISSPGQDTKRFLRPAVGFEAISDDIAEERGVVTEPPSAWKTMAEKLSKHFKAFVEKIKNFFRQMTGKGVKTPKVTPEAAPKPVANSENIPIVHDADGKPTKTIVEPEEKIPLLVAHDADGNPLKPAEADVNLPIAYDANGNLVTIPRVDHPQNAEDAVVPSINDVIPPSSWTQNKKIRTSSSIDEPSLKVKDSDANTLKLNDVDAISEGHPKPQVAEGEHEAVPKPQAAEGEHEAVPKPQVAEGEHEAVPKPQVAEGEHEAAPKAVDADGNVETQPKPRDREGEPGESNTNFDPESSHKARDRSIAGFQPTSS